VTPPTFKITIGYLAQYIIIYISNVICYELTVSCYALTVSCYALTVSCYALTVSCYAPTVSCYALTVSCYALTVSCYALTVSCHWKANCHFTFRFIYFLHHIIEEGLWYDLERRIVSSRRSVRKKLST
jgi:hypothetical protein